MQRSHRIWKKVSTALLLFTFLFQPLLPLFKIPVRAEELPVSYPESTESEASVEVTEESSGDNTWESIGSTSYQTTVPVELGVEYVYPGNSDVRITFTSLPEITGNLTISEITLTEDQLALTGAVSRAAFDITTSMQNGTFEYDLTLPVPQSIENISIEYAEDVSELGESKEIAQKAEPFSNTITLKNLDHFTVFIVTSPLGGGVANGDEVNADCSATLPGSGRECFDTIQAAINAAVDGEVITVLPGTYTENLIINKNITLESQGDRTDTTIIGISEVGATGTILINGGTTGITIDGFTIEGIDNSSPANENAAIYFQGANSGAYIVNNEIIAKGDSGITSQSGGSAISNVTIDNNIFSGQTFLGAQPAGIGFGNQFSTLNVPRQLVVINPGGTGNVFTNNTINGITGGISSDDNTTPQGNSLITIDTTGSVITGNTFGGITTNGGHCLRVRGANSVISGNSFECSTTTAPGLFVGSGATGSIVDSNNFDTTTGGAQYQIDALGVTPTGLAVPVLLSPADEIVINTIPTLQDWSDVSSAAQYKYQRCDSNPGDFGGACSDIRYETNLVVSERQIGAPLEDQIFWWRVKAVDVHGNESNWSEAFEVSVDVTDPVVTIDTLDTRDRTPELTGTISEPGAEIEVDVFGTTYVATNNGDGTWTLPNDYITPNLADGTYEIEVTATDLAGNTGTDSSTDELFVDRTAPEVLTINDLVDGQVINSNDVFTFTGDVNDFGSGMLNGAAIPYDNGIAFRLYPTGFSAPADRIAVEWAVVDTATDTYEVTFDPADLVEGSYDFRIAAYDQIGNARVLVITGFVVDNTAPVITITDDIEVGPINADTFEFNVADSNGDVASYAYAISTDSVCDASDTYTLGTTYTETTEVNNGSYLCAYAVDEAGNETYAVSAEPLNIDEIAPTIGGTVAVRVDSSDTFISGNNVRLRMSATDVSGIDYCEYTIDNGATWLPADYNSADNQCEIDGVVVPDGDVIDAALRVFDNAGNLSTGGYVDYISDAAGPAEFSSELVPSVNGYTNDAPGIAAVFRDSKTTVEECEFRFRESTGSYGAWEDGTLVRTFFLPKWGTCFADFSGLTNGVNYDFQLRVTDGVGNETVLGFNATVDEAEPISTIDSPLDNSYWNSGIEIEGSTTDTGSGVSFVLFEASLSGDNDWSVIAFEPNSGNDEPFNWNLNWTPPTEGAYDIRARAFDNFLNEGIDYVSNVTYDTTAPVVTNINLFVNGTDTDLAKSGDTLRIVADIEDTNPIDYVQLWVRDFPYTGEQITSGTMSLVSGNTYQFEFVLPDTYQSTAALNETELGNYFNFRAWDVAGNSFIGYRENFTIDNTAPVVEITAPADGTEVNGTIEVRGSVNDPHPWRYYAVVKDSSNSVVGGVNTVYRSTSFTDELLFNFDTTSVPDGEYIVHLAARDLAGNRVNSAGSQDEITIIVNNLGTIKGTKFNDVNGNGVFDASERSVNTNRINNWEITLYDSNWDTKEVQNSRNVGGRGKYAFEDLEAGTYYLCESSTLGGDIWYQNYPASVGESVLNNNGDVVNDNLSVANISANSNDEAGYCWEVVLEVGETASWMRFGNQQDLVAPSANLLEDQVFNEGDAIPAFEIIATDNRDVDKLCVLIEDSPLGAVGEYCYLDNEVGNTEFEWDLAEILETLTGDTIFDTSVLPEGVYEVEYYVTDKSGNRSEPENYAFTVTIENVAPEVSLLSNQTILEGNAASFSGSFTDPSTLGDQDSIFDDSTWSVEINYGDGNNVTLDDMSDEGSFVIPDHTYTNNGTYVVRATVCESSIIPVPTTLTTADPFAGETECGFDEVEVTVANVLPSVSIAADPGVSVLSGTIVELTADTTGNLLLGNQVESLVWGGDCTGGTGIQFDLATPNATSYTCTVLATDVDGDTATAKITVSANNDLPSVIIFAEPAVTVTEGTVISLFGNILSGDPTFDYVFSGDCSGSGSNAGGLTTGVTVPSTAGNYLCIITVTDVNGDVAASSATVAVVPAAVGTGGDVTPDDSEGSVAGESTTAEDEDESGELGRGSAVLGLFDSCESDKKSIISGFVYQRSDDNEDLNDSDNPLDGIRVRVFGFDEFGERVLASELETNSDGYYELELCEGSYEVEIVKSDLEDDAELVTSDVLSVSLGDDDSEGANFVIENQDEGNFNWWWLLLPFIILSLLIFFGYYSQRRQGNA